MLIMKMEHIQAKNYIWVKGEPQVGSQGHGDGAEEGQSLEERGCERKERKG